MVGEAHGEAASQEDQRKNGCSKAIICRGDVIFWLICILISWFILPLSLITLYVALEFHECAFGHCAYANFVKFFEVNHILTISAFYCKY
jgi:hypothetical protein